MLQSEFNHVGTMRYQPHESRYARESLQRFMEHIKYLPTTPISLVGEAVDVINRAAIPGEYLVEFLPFLHWVPDWMPGAGWKRMAKEWKKIANEMIEETYMRAKKSTTTIILTVDICRNEGSGRCQTFNTEEQEQVIKETTATLYAGTRRGYDSLGPIHVFLAMLLYPETQARAQAELDEVLGRSRLPDFGNDEYELPYVKAIVLEALRWMPVTPLGSSHKEEYKGYRIPAGSIVFANTWSILHDAAVFTDPEVFKPERWLHKVCPGRHLAVSSLWIAAAPILSVFNITEEVGYDGKEVEPRMEYNSALICHPKQFKCSIKPRFPEAEDLIRASINEY
ncbi:cytochrome P450 [Pleurotus eryngii]|uniref:Cytochrome P450 n=1 Tax=Pleurotus eryngii TaxID=5323 RepID=A0A9P5ZNS4_PLEER|nr:cytochrome P450 [Pleurotus eryngii]